MNAELDPTTGLTAETDPTMFNVEDLRRKGDPRKLGELVMGAAFGFSDETEAFVLDLVDPEHPKSPEVGVAPAELPETPETMNVVDMNSARQDHELAQQAVTAALQNNPDRPQLPPIAA